MLTWSAACARLRDLPPCPRLCPHCRFAGAPPAPAGPRSHEHLVSFLLSPAFQDYLDYVSFLRDFLPTLKM
jgi:hypothetical protein